MASNSQSGKQQLPFFVKLIVVLVALSWLLYFLYGQGQLIHLKRFWTITGKASKKRMNQLSNPLDREEASLEIAFWVPSKSPINNVYLKRMRAIVTTMNKVETENEVCGRDFFGKEGNNCKFSIETEDISKADAVVYFMLKGLKRSYLPLNRSDRNPKQLWIMYVRTPPPLSRWRGSFRGVINWTMTYRMDSDVWVPYGRKLPVSPRRQNNSSIYIGNVTLKEWISRKSKLVAGVFFKCRTESRRELLIRKMNESSTGEVNVFGNCGERIICKDGSTNCADLWNVLAQYKFYMAFESFVCEDYITSKFWESLRHGIVPVVYGGGNYSLEAPPHSYIDVRNFKSVKSLMKFLKTLNENDSKYAKYFEWRKKFRIEENRMMSHDWCALCHAIQRRKKSNTSYKNAFRWWHFKPNSNERACKRGNEYLELVATKRNITVINETVL